jgi:iron(III) transport system ATP-binding protein
MSFLDLKNISKNFGNKQALIDVSATIEKGEFVCILGPSGCGKSTLLRIIAGLEGQHEGDILLRDTSIAMLPPEKRNFGIVFQSYALFPNLTVYKNIAFGLENRKQKGNEISKKVSEILKIVELEECKDRYPYQLSGGEQQRVALARAIVLSPEFLLLDEPLSALDAKVRVKLRNQIRELQRKLGITTIMVTHDQEEALSMADKIIVMKDGAVMQIGTPQEIYKFPANVFVADFVGSINFIEDSTKQNTYAIRPEDIIIGLGDSGRYNIGKIKDMEYKGAYYLAKITWEASEIKASIPCSEVERLNIKAGSNISFQINYKNAIKFFDESCA